MRRIGATFITLAACTQAAPAIGAVTIQSQQRTLTVATTANAATQTASAANLGPFVDTLTVDAPFQSPTGTLTNGATGRIDCQIDPNSVRARGAFTVAGGANLAGGLETGDAKCDIRVTFLISEPTPFAIMATPRPTLLPTDGYEVQLKDLTRHDTLVEVDESSAPQQIGLQGVLQPGTYFVRFSAETASNGSEATREYAFNLSLGCRADFDGSGTLSTQDVLDFVSAWFDNDLRADVDLHDGVTIPDIFAFLNVWFAGC
jgi:hypothetical protein